MSALVPAAGRMCQFCGSKAQHLHHLTGRGPDGDQLDPDLVVGLCRKHHQLVHADLRTQFLDTANGDGWDDFTAVRHRLARLALYFGRLDDYGDEPLWAALAHALPTWLPPTNPTERQQK